MSPSLHRSALLLATLAGASLAAANCTGTIGNGEGAGSNPNAEPEAVYEPAPAAVPRLTELQYRNTLADLMGTDLPELHVEPDTNPHLFDSIGSSSTSLSELGTQEYEENADAVTWSVFSDPARRAVLVGCEVASPGDACARDFIARFGRKAFRRPLGTAELARWVDVSTALAQANGALPPQWEGLRLVTSGMLQSPSFIYQIELGEPDPDHEGDRRLTGYEMAARLSFLLWNSTPDDELLDAAEAGDLDGDDGVATAAHRLLASPRAKTTLQRFFGQYLDLGRLDTVTRDPATYPLFAADMNASMRHEVELLVDDVVFEQHGDARSIFTTRHTFVNADLAALYGVTDQFVAHGGVDASTFVAVDLDPNGKRAGILTLGAYLTMNAHETRTSPTARGKFIRERVLCEDVPAPPPNVNTDLPPPDPNGEELTVRQQLEEHQNNPQCVSCHSFIDPPGFLFEHFDPIGAYREYEGDHLTIDSSGDLDGTPLADAIDLAKMLETDPRVGECMVKQLYRDAMGRLESEGEAPAITELGESFEKNGFDFEKLLVSLVTHPSYRRLAEPQEGP